jgi:signal transduction histidine kinase
MPTSTLTTSTQGGLLAAGFAVVLAMSAGSLLLVARTDETVEAAAHASNVLTGLSALRTDLLLAESGQRGFLLTGDNAYRRDTAAAMLRVPTTLNRLAELTADDPAALDTVRRLDELATAKLAELRSTLELLDEGRRDEAMGVVGGGRGLALMNEFIERSMAMTHGEWAEVVELLDRADGLRNAVLGVNIAGGIVVAVLATASVLLIRRKARQLVAAHLALENVNQALEERVAERTADLREANDEIQRFAYIVSHDLRSPLVNIMGFTSELEAVRAELFPESAAAGNGGQPRLGTEGDAADPARAQLRQDFDEALKFITVSIAKMDRLIHAVLDLSRAGRREFKPQPVDLYELVKSIAGDVQHRVQDNAVELKIGRLPRVVSDRLALEQIFSNLIDNALKYLRRDVPGRIEVTAEETMTRVAIRVSDNGRGIDPKDRERIFELFRRAGAQDRPGEGIGLAHVRTLVRRLGGSITVEGEPGVGSTFTVTIPKKWSDT